MTEKQYFLEFWGLENSPDADEQWERKLRMDEKTAFLRGNEANMGVIPDIQPYKSMIDGSIIHSRSRHKTHLRDHGCVEIGNEVAAASKIPEPKHVDLKPEIIRQVYAAKEKLRRKH